ncbi:hypothetical protein PFISCL1PPCAC_28161, partial [Pristionchus fissidentatus]
CFESLGQEYSLEKRCDFFTTVFRIYHTSSAELRIANHNMTEEEKQIVNIYFIPAFLNLFHYYSIDKSLPLLREIIGGMSYFRVEIFPVFVNFLQEHHYNSSMEIGPFVMLRVEYLARRWIPMEFSFKVCFKRRELNNSWWDDTDDGVNVKYYLHEYLLTD